MSKNNLIKASGSMLINQNVTLVFDFFADPGNDHLWRAEINKSVTDRPLQTGVTVAEYSYLSKKASNNLVEMTCVQFDKNETAVFETAPGAPFYQKSQRMVKAISDKQTEVIYTLDFDKRIVKFALGFGLPGFIIAMKAGADMKKYLKQLKKQLENT